jgi:hypothetical protein
MSVRWTTFDTGKIALVRFATMTSKRRAVRVDAGLSRAAGHRRAVLCCWLLVPGWRLEPDARAP